MVALERASQPEWEDLEESLGVHLPFLAGSSPPSCGALDRLSLGARTSPLRRHGMLEPEGSVAAGLGGGARPSPHLPPPTPRGLGEEEAPTLTGRWAWRPVGKAFPGPSRPEGSLSGPSLRPALLSGAKAESGKTVFSPQCSSFWLLSHDPSTPGPGSKQLLSPLPGMFCCHLSPWNSGFDEPKSSYV